MSMLRNVRSAMPAGATLLIIERLLTADASFVSAQASHFVDLLMMSNFEVSE